MIITLDLGTTSNRCLAISEAGTLLASHQHEFTQYFPQPGWVEHDANEIWNSAKTVLEQTLKSLTSDPLALAITNQRETVVAWDVKTKMALCPAIVWQCRRTASRMDSLPTQIKTIIKQKTGLPADAYFSASKMEWLLQNVDAVKHAADQGTLRFGTIDSWILFKLTNGTAFATDSSNASRTQLMNIHTQSYDPFLLHLFGINPEWLPEIKTSDSLFGTVSPRIFASSTHIPHTPPLPIHAILGDQQAALFAQCGDDTSRIKNTYGTGLFICAPTGSKPLETSSLLTTIAWSRNNIITYAVEGSIFVGGSAIQWCRDGLGIISSAAESDALASSLDHNETVYFVPALTGLGAPYWDASARGMFIGLTRGTTKAHLIRAVLESLAYQTKDVCDCLVTTQTSHGLYVDGGASVNAFLMQFQADILAMPVIKSSVTESTAYGVAGLAGIAIGLFTEKLFRSFLSIERTYSPRFKKETIDVYYSQWKNAVQRSRQWA